MRKNWILLLCVVIIGCNKIKEGEKEYFHQSQGLYNYNLHLKDSLIYKLENKFIIAKIYKIIKRNDNYLIIDKGLKCIYVMDKEFKKIIKKIGKKGKGPGEYTSTPLIIEGTTDLEVMDISKRSVNIYNDSFEFVTSKNMDPNFIYNSFTNLYFHGKYILFSLYPYSVNKDEYYQKYKSVILFNKDLTFYKEILDWDKIYTEPSLTGYSRNNLSNFCTLGLNNSFFIIQGAIYYIYKIGTDLTTKEKFGIKPLNYKDPPRGVKFNDTQKSFETLVEYFSKVTIISNLSFDKKNERIFLEYDNTTEDTFYKRNKFLTDRYLQIYDSEYNCIFDGKINGVFLFTDGGNIYILEDENPDFIKIKIYSLIKKSANEDEN